MQILPTLQYHKTPSESVQDQNLIVLTISVHLDSYVCKNVHNQQKKPNKLNRNVCTSTRPKIQHRRIIIQTAPSNACLCFPSYAQIYAEKAIPFLISAMASAGFNPLGHVLEQLRMVWHRYKLMELLSASCRSAVFSSRESAIHR